MATFTNLDSNAKQGFIDKAKQWGRNALSAAQRLFNRLVKSGNYNLHKEIQSNPWYKAQNGGALARIWFAQKIAPDSAYHSKRQYMEPGRLYMFVYANPKHADILDWYDVYPLVMSLGSYVSQEGELVEMGINLHHLPLKVRILVLCKIFEAFASKYQGEMYRAEQKPIDMTWQQVGALVQQYGAAFAFRSYLPQLRTGTICFKYEDWYKAIFIPSNHYEKMTAQQICNMYMQYLKDKHIMFNVSDTTM